MKVKPLYQIRVQCIVLVSSTVAGFLITIELFSDFFGVCTADDKNNRVLTEYYEASEDMTIEMCLSICRSKGFPFSGLEWSCECHCGYEPVNGFEWSWSSKCEDRCTGDSNQACGGSNALSLWTTPPKHPSGLCINDYPENQRILNEYSVTGLDDMTIEYCASICEGESKHLNR